MHSINHIKPHIVFRICAERSCFKIHTLFLWEGPPSKPQGYLSGKPSNLESKVIMSKHHDQQQEWAEQGGETVKWFSRGRETCAGNSGGNGCPCPAPAQPHTFFCDSFWVQSAKKFRQSNTMASTIQHHLSQSRLDFGRITLDLSRINISTEKQKEASSFWWWLV